jgi:amino-acid N-acetyltransferase
MNVIKNGWPKTPVQAKSRATMRMRKAKNGDVLQMRALINEMAMRSEEGHRFGHMLPRSLTELYEHIRDYTVLVDEEDRVLGCCALQSQWDGLAELKALAVATKCRNQGWGRNLVETVLSEAENLGIDCIYTLTNKMEFFTKLGLRPSTCANCRSACGANAPTAPSSWSPAMKSR